jgi:hypothetical protein
MLNIGGHHEGAVFDHSIDRRCALGTRACTYRFLNLLIIIKVLVRVSPMIRIARPGDISATINLASLLWSLSVSRCSIIVYPLTVEPKTPRHCYARLSSSRVADVTEPWNDIHELKRFVCAFPTAAIWTRQYSDLS